MLKQLFDCVALRGLLVAAKQQRVFGSAYRDIYLIQSYFALKFKGSEIRHYNDVELKSFSFPHVREMNIETPRKIIALREQSWTTQDRRPETRCEE